MWSPRFSVVALALLVPIWVSCGGSQPPSHALSSTWVAPPILSYVPADSPYLVASIEPMNEKIRERMLRGLDKRATELLRLAQTQGSSERASLEPWMRAGLALIDELHGKDLKNWWQELGFAPSGRFVLYGLSVWPVARMEVANPARLRAVIERALSAAGTRPSQGTLDGHAYWRTGNAEMTLVAAVLDHGSAHEAVAALIPTPALASALPLVLGTQKPAKSLATEATVPELFRRHRFLGFLVAYLDARKAADIVVSERPSELDAPLHALTGPIPPACRTDLDRLVEVAPRFVLGYRRLDEVGFDASAVIESSPGVIGALRKLHTTVPGVTTPVAGRPLLALGTAINPDEVVAWLRGVTTGLHDHPFTCPWFTKLNEAGTELAQEIAAPLPPMLRGVRGFSMVIDEATILPPSVVGHVLVASDHLADLVSSLSSAVPAIAGIPIPRDGRPVAIPTQQLGLPIPSAHVAMTPDRLVVASGPQSAQRAADRLASPVPPRSPLFLMAFDAPRIQKLLASMGQSEIADLGYLGNVGMSLDAADEGIGFDVWGTWGDAPPPAQLAH